jgi:uncharacterized SAM-binding protein YcdF (DUF218 family)
MIFIIKPIFSIIRNILASLGVAFISLICVCLFTSVPNDLFTLLKVEPKLENADAIVVLGAGVTEGGKPSRFSLERTVDGVILFKQNYAPYMIFSGGWDHDGYISSAEAMADTAIKLGVPESRILVEDKSHDTHENAINTAAIMKANGLQSAILVTSDSHMKRSAILFSKQNLLIYPAPVEEFLPKSELSWRSKMHNFNVLYQVLYEASAAVKYKSNGWI